METEQKKEEWKMTPEEIKQLREILAIKSSLALFMDLLVKQGQQVARTEAGMWRDIGDRLKLSPETSYRADVDAGKIWKNESR